MVVAVVMVVVMMMTACRQSRDRQHVYGSIEKDVGLFDSGGDGYSGGCSGGVGGGDGGSGGDGTGGGGGGDVVLQSAP